jgi:uncharacterized protein YjbI with pentapeptide repeats
MALCGSGAAIAFDEADLVKLQALNACEGCDLSGADLSEADLGGANLENANLSEANLFGANLEKAAFTLQRKSLY